MWFLVVLVCCGGLLGFAFFQQYRAFLDPCPLCILQRACFMWMALVALLAVLHNPGRRGGRAYGVLAGLGAACGAAIAGRHVWLQNLPPEQVPECGPGLNYMLETLPLTEVFSKVFLGSGSCADVLWTFLGLSMPGWTLTWFLALGGGTLWMVFRKS
jgi:disulfide bond formation protein DsbB